MPTPNYDQYKLAAPNESHDCETVAEFYGVEVDELTDRMLCDFEEDRSEVEAERRTDGAQGLEMFSMSNHMIALGILCLALNIFACLAQSVMFLGNRQRGRSVCATMNAVFAVATAGCALFTIYTMVR